MQNIRIRGTTGDYYWVHSIHSGKEFAFTPTALFFLTHLTQNRYFGDFPNRISWLGTEKLNITQQKHAFTNQKKCTTTQNKQANLKPGVVASYDIRPGNGEGLFWCWRFIGCHLNYLLT